MYARQRTNNRFDSLLRGHVLVGSAANPDKEGGLVYDSRMSAIMHHHLADYAVVVAFRDLRNHKSS